MYIITELNKPIDSYLGTLGDLVKDKSAVRGAGGLRGQALGACRRTAAAIANQCLYEGELEEEGVTENINEEQNSTIPSVAQALHGIASG